MSKNDDDKKVDLAPLIFASGSEGLTHAFDKIAERPIEKSASAVLTARFSHKHKPPEA